ncbi:hypothetical protein ACWIGI_28545 [Nocardia sp. NPDC055321]
MPREYARFQLSIWEDDDFLNLTPPAQHLYFVLATDPGLSYCGRVDWRPARLRVRASQWTPEQINSAAAELEHARFVLFDLDTEEALVRALIRSDELLRNPKMGVSVVKAYGAVASRALRAAVVTEVKRDHVEHPDYSSFSSAISREQITRLMGRPDLEQVGYTNQISNDITNEIGTQIGDAEPVAITNPIGNRNGNADRSTSYLHTADSRPQTCNQKALSRASAHARTHPYPPNADAAPHPSRTTGNPPTPTTSKHAR